jgi:hypothetical protein
VANYSVDIEIAIQGAQKLKAFENQLKLSVESVDTLNKTLMSIGNLVPKTFNNLSAALQKANNNFKQSIVTTKQGYEAAKLLVKAESEVNAELERREKLLNRLRGKPTSAFAEFSQAATAVSANVNSPVARSLRRRQEKLAGDPFAYAGPIGPGPASSVALSSSLGRRLEDEISKRREALGLIRETVRANIEESRTARAARADALSASRDRVNQARLERNLAERGLMMGTGGQVLRGISNAGFGIQGPALPPGGVRRPSSMQFGGGREAVGNAIIGGAFPFLFGQSGAAAAGGALGGAAGGLLGGTFGFGLSLVGTAIGDFIDKADRLNASLRTLNVGIENTGNNSITTAGDVKQLASALKLETDNVLELLRAYGQFRDGGTREALVSLFSGFGDSATFEAIAKAGLSEKDALESVFSLRKLIGNEAAKALALSIRTGSALEIQQKLLKLIADESIKVKVAAASQVSFWDEIRGRLAQGVVLAARFASIIQNLQFGGIKLPIFDQIINKLKGISPESIAKDRGKALEKSLKADIDRINKALDKETELLGLERDLTKELQPQKEGRKSQVAQLQNQYLALRDQLTVQKDLYQAELANNDIAVVRFNQAIKLLDLRKQENEVALEDIPTNEKAVKLRTIQLDRTKANLEAMYQIAAIEQRLNEARQQALGNSNERINRLAAEIQGKERDYELTQRISELEKAGLDPADAKAQAETEFQLLEIKNEQVRTQQRLNDLVGQFGSTTLSVFEDIVFATDSWTNSLGNALRLMASSLFRYGLTSLANAGDPAGQGIGLLSILTGGFGKRAAGGPVSAGSPYLVGERGPELFMPRTSGSIYPNDAMGMGGANIVVNVDAGGSSVGGDPGQANQLGKAIGIAVQQELIKQKRPGGLLA